MIGCPRFGEGFLQVLGSGDAGRKKTSVSLRERGNLERSPLGTYFRPVAPSLSCLEVEGVGQGVSYLVQLSPGDLSRLVDPFDDLSRGSVGHLALLSACPEFSSMLVPLSELPWPLEPSASHVRPSVLPHGVVPRPVRVHRVIAHIFILPVLPSLDETGIPRSLS